MTTFQNVHTAICQRIAAAGSPPIIPTALFSSITQDERDQAGAKLRAWNSAITATVTDGLRTMKTLADHGDIACGSFLERFVGARPAYGDEPEEVYFDEPSLEDIKTKIEGMSAAHLRQAFLGPDA